MIFIIVHCLNLVNFKYFFILFNYYHYLVSTYNLIIYSILWVLYWFTYIKYIYRTVKVIGSFWDSRVNSLHSTYWDIVHVSNHICITHLKKIYTKYDRNNIQKMLYQSILYCITFYVLGFYVDLCWTFGLIIVFVWKGWSGPLTNFIANWN